MIATCSPLMHKDLLARLCAGLQRNEKTGCLEWQKAKDSHGYGRIWWQGRLWSTHRIAWMVFNGPIPDDLHVLHKNTCHNRACAEIDHLYLGTQSDNMYDVGRLGMNSMQTNPQCGEQARHVKLTGSEVAEIRQRYAEGGMSYRTLGCEYHVSKATIYSIVVGRTWKKE